MVFHGFACIFIQLHKRSFTYGICNKNISIGQYLKIIFNKKITIGIIIQITNILPPQINLKSVKPIDVTNFIPFYFSKTQLLFRKLLSKHYENPNTAIFASNSFYKFKTCLKLHYSSLTKLNKIHILLDYTQIKTISKLAKILSTTKYNSTFHLQWQLILKNYEIYLYVFQQILNNNQNILIISQNFEYKLINLLNNKLKKQPITTKPHLCAKILKTIHQHPGTIIIGPFSSIFVSLPNLGLILIENENTDTYKQFLFCNKSKILTLYIKISHAKLIFSSITYPINNLYYNNSKLLTICQSFIKTHIKKLTIVNEKFLTSTYNLTISNKAVHQLNQTLSHQNQALLIFDSFNSSYKKSCIQCNHKLTCQMSNDYHKNKHPNCEIRIVLPCQECINTVLRFNIYKKNIHTKIKELFPSQKIILISKSIPINSIIFKYIFDQKINIIITTSKAIYKNYYLHKLSFIGFFYIGKNSLQSNFCTIEQWISSLLHIYSLLPNPYKSTLFIQKFNINISPLFIFKRKYYAILKWKLIKLKQLKLPPFYLSSQLQIEHNKKYLFFVFLKIKNILKELDPKNLITVSEPIPLINTKNKIYKWQLVLKFQNTTAKLNKHCRKIILLINRKIKRLN